MRVMLKNEINGQVRALLRVRVITMGRERVILTSKKTNGKRERES